MSFQNKILIFGIRFSNISNSNKEQLFQIDKKIAAFPAAPALVNLFNDKKYQESLSKIDYVLFDSGLLCLLLKFKSIFVKKYSGLAFLRDFFQYLRHLKKATILTIDPSNEELLKNKKFIQNLNEGLVVKGYVAPFYQGNIQDPNLIRVIKEVKPNYIIINIGGGTQEILATYLHKEIKNLNINIYCTGAAIAFLTKSQSPISPFIDSLYLGWLVRCLFKPNLYIPRYLKAFKLIFIFIKYRKSIKFNA